MKKNFKVGYLGPKFNAFEKKNSKCVRFLKIVATHLSYRVTFLYKNSILHDEQVQLSDNWWREWVALAYLWFVLTFSSVPWGLYVKNLTDKIVEIEKTHISTDFNWFWINRKTFPIWNSSLNISDNRRLVLCWMRSEFRP